MSFIASLVSESPLPSMRSSRKIFTFNITHYNLMPHTFNTIAALNASKNVSVIATMVKTQSVVIYTAYCNHE